MQNDANIINYESKFGNYTFFDSPEKCIESYKKLSVIKKLISCIQSYGTLFLYAIHRLYQKMTTEKNWANKYTIKLETHEKNKLIVLLHGLNNSPLQFKKIITGLEKIQNPDFAIYAPEILEKGNAKLDDMVKPIFDQIKNWSASDCDKEIILIGVSNGARIARGIEAELRNSLDTNVKNIKKLKFISIVGACQGSSLARWANDHFLGWLMSKNIREEIPEDSNSVQRLNIKISDSYPLSYSLSTQYFFFASPHDWQIPNKSSTLMNPQHCFSNHLFNSLFTMVLGHGHNSIVDAVSDSVVQLIEND